MYKIIGYRNNYVYSRKGSDIFRALKECDLVWRWHSTVAGFYADVKAFGKLSDAEGKELDIFVMPIKIPKGDCPYG